MRGSQAPGDRNARTSEDDCRRLSRGRTGKPRAFERIDQPLWNRKMVPCMDWLRKRRKGGNQCPLSSKRI